MNNNQQGQNNQESTNLFNKNNPFTTAVGSSQSGGSQTSQISFGNQVQGLKSNLFPGVQQSGDNQQPKDTVSNTNNTNTITNVNPQPGMFSGVLQGSLSNNPLFGSINQTSGGNNTSSTANISKVPFSLQSNTSNSNSTSNLLNTTANFGKPQGQSFASSTGQSGNELNKGFSFSNNNNISTTNTTSNTGNQITNNPFNGGGKLNTQNEQNKEDPNKQQDNSKNTTTNTTSNTNSTGNVFSFNQNKPQDTTSGTTGLTGNTTSLFNTNKDNQNGNQSENQPNKQLFQNSQNNTNNTGATGTGSNLNNLGVPSSGSDSNKPMFGGLGLNKPSGGLFNSNPTTTENKGIGSFNLMGGITNTNTNKQEDTLKNTENTENKNLLSKTNTNTNTTNILGSNQPQSETAKNLFSKPEEGAKNTLSFGAKIDTSNIIGGNKPISLGNIKTGEQSGSSIGGNPITFGAKLDSTTTEENKFNFGANPNPISTGTTTNNPINFSKPEVSDKFKPNELFSKTVPKTEEKKDETGSKIVLGGGKDSSLSKDNVNKLQDTSKNQPKKDVDEAALNSMMKKSIEDVVNHWKNDLDNQVDKFESNAESLKHFETVFLKNFETICSLNELINNLQQDGQKTIRTLEDISGEEDQIIEQLNIMDRVLDDYLSGYQGFQNVESKNIYNTALEISRTVDEVQKDIDEVNSKISEPMQQGKEDNLNVISYENPILKENISLNKNEFTSILNSYYTSLRSIQFMEQSLESKIRQVDAEIKDRKMEKEKEYNKYY